MTHKQAVGGPALRPMALACAAVAMALAGGCASTEDPTRYYQLAPVPPSAPTGEVPDYELVVDTVRLPDELDRTAMVVRQSATQSRVLDDHRWLSPLSDQLTHALVSDLQSALPRAWVRPRDMPGRTARRYGLRIDVEQMALASDASVTLLANWTVLDAKDQVLRRDRASVRVDRTPGTAPVVSDPALPGMDPDALARIASEAVARLAVRIAQTPLLQATP
jgi:uncharacterized lipoprotein YmbA